MGVPPIPFVLRSLAAVLAGFAVITGGTIFTFVVVLDGIGASTSTPGELAVGAFGALLSGFLGGAVAAWLASRLRFAHAAALVLPIGLDTATIVFSSSPASDPLWFDLTGSAILLLGALVGGWIVETRRERAEQPVEEVASGAPGSR